MKEQGGPAFPVNGYSPDFNGMTLRDYFAANASEIDIEANRNYGESIDNPKDRCVAKYRYADAMLKARQE